MSKQGFIKLYRQVQDHWIYDEKRKFSKFEAWVDMIMQANHQDNKFVLGNELVEVKKGQFITSIRKLGERWDWSNTKITNFLDLLKSDGMIDYKKDTKKTVVTIVNYGLYHDNGNEKTTRQRHDNDTTTTQKHTNKNVKNDKNEKNKDYTSKIKDLLSGFSSINNFNELNKRYWDVIRETRTTKKISPSVICKNMELWKKYDGSVIEYALKTHIEAHVGKREEYTIGIMRRTTKEEAEDYLSKKINIGTHNKGNKMNWDSVIEGLEDD